MKIKLTVLSGFVLLCCVSCKKEVTAGITVSEAKNSETGKVATHYVGERFGGGVVFIVNASGRHGLIADTADLGIYTWYNNGYVITGASGNVIGTGQANTQKIVAAQGSAGSYAALACVTSKRSGYTDWFLPSKAELLAMYDTKDLIGGFTDGFYWSSSEKTISTAWEQGFQDGFRNYYYKCTRDYVRAVRVF